MKTKAFLFILSLCGLSLVWWMLLEAPLSAAGPNPPATAVDQDVSTEVIAYYFHGNVRCPTCKKLEAYSKEAIIEGFPQRIENKTLIFRIVNTDEAENKHFIKDFNLVTKSLVLVKDQDGTAARFENLNLIWQKVRDKDSFLSYVRDETGRFIDQR